MTKELVEWGYYTSVRFSTIDPIRKAFIFQYDENHHIVIGVKEVARVIQRLKDGHDHVTACPAHGLTREDAAFFLAEGDRILRDIKKVMG